MTKANISITLSRGSDSELHQHPRFKTPVVMRYQPGTQIYGSVICHFTDDTQLKEFKVALKCVIWETTACDTRVVQESVAPALRSGVPPTYTADFTFTIPYTPWSYIGDLFQIIWLIEVDTGKTTLPLGFGSPIRQSTAIWVRPIVE